MVTSATIGATLLLIAVKLAFGESVAAKIGSKVKFMETNFKTKCFLLSTKFKVSPDHAFLVDKLSCWSL